MVFTSKYMDVWIYDVNF